MNGEEEARSYTPEMPMFTRDFTVTFQFNCDYFT